MFPTNSPSRRLLLGDSGGPLPLSAAAVPPYPSSSPRRLPSFTPEARCPARKAAAGLNRRWLVSRADPGGVARDWAGTLAATAAARGGDPRLSPGSPRRRRRGSASSFPRRRRLEARVSCGAAAVGSPPPLRGLVYPIPTSGGELPLLLLQTLACNGHELNPREASHGDGGGPGSQIRRPGERIRQPRGRIYADKAWSCCLSRWRRWAAPRKATPLLIWPVPA